MLGRQECAPPRETPGASGAGAARGNALLQGLLCHGPAVGPVERGGIRSRPVGDGEEGAVSGRSASLRRHPTEVSLRIVLRHLLPMTCRCEPHLLPIAASLCPQRLNEQSLDITDCVIRVSKELLRCGTEQM